MKIVCLCGRVVRDQPETCAACRYWAPDLRPVTATLPGDGDCGVAPRLVRRRGAMVACKEGELRDG